MVDANPKLVYCTESVLNHIKKNIQLYIANYILIVLVFDKCLNGMKCPKMKTQIINRKTLITLKYNNLQ